MIATLDRDDLFAGNIDTRKIKNIAKDYGFSTQTDKTRTRDGIDIPKIKENRKDLAQGFKSFK